jgi:hypothetical protein
MENEINKFKRVTLKLSEDSYEILLNESKEKKREQIIQDSLLLYSRVRIIHNALFDMLTIVRYVKIAIEYMNYNLVVDDRDNNIPYKKNYEKAVYLLQDLESHLTVLRNSFFEKYPS